MWLLNWVQRAIRGEQKIREITSILSAQLCPEWISEVWDQFFEFLSAAQITLIEATDEREWYELSERWNRGEKSFLPWFRGRQELHCLSRHTP